MCVAVSRLKATLYCVAVAKVVVVVTRGGGLLDRIYALDLIHGRSRMTINRGGEGSHRFIARCFCCSSVGGQQETAVRVGGWGARKYKMAVI